MSSGSDLAHDEDTVPATGSLPKLGHLPRSTFEEVYEPSDDTYLMVDVLEAEREQLKALAPSICLEIGGGSGCLSAALASRLPRTAARLHKHVRPRCKQIICMGVMS